MTARTRGTGSRSSPIVIDDDDDKDQPQRNKVRSGPFAAHTETPPHVHGSVIANNAKARDSIPTGQEEPDQLRNGIGYSILIRMGYKPGHGLGVNLEGNRPLSAILLGG
jgi:G-patch domain